MEVGIPQELHLFLEATIPFPVHLRSLFQIPNHPLNNPFLYFHPSRDRTEDILHQAGEAVMQSQQKPDEDENASAERIEEAARDCTYVYTEHDLVSAYIRGLPDTTRHLVGMKVEAMDYDELSNLLTAKRIALAEVHTVRTRHMKSGSANSTNHGATRRPTMVVPETPRTAGLGQNPSDTSVSSSYMDPVLYAP